MFSLLPITAAVFSLLLAAAALLRRRRSPAVWYFAAGMSALALDSLFAGLGLRGTTSGDVRHWLTLSSIVQSFTPAAWLAFSLTYARVSLREASRTWKIVLAALAVAPAAIWLGLGDAIAPVALTGAPAEAWPLQYGPAARAVSGFVVVALVLVLTNLEHTFRSAVGTTRWRIKYVVLGLAVIFGTAIYARVQAILFPLVDPVLLEVESAALLIGCAFLALAFVRAGLAEIDVYPSRAILRSSITVLLVGSYLLVVGLLAEAVRWIGGAGSFRLQALVVLLGIAGLSVLLLSDRVRHATHGFLARHFRPAQHDSVRIWTDLSRRLADVKDQRGLAAVSSRLVSETFDALSVTVWLLDEAQERIAAVASTARQPDAGAPADATSGAIAAGLRPRTSPFDLEQVDEPWAVELRRLNPMMFADRGGNRWCVPLRAAETLLGVVVLADRVGGTPYTDEDRELLRCIGDHVTSVLRNLRLADEVAQAKETEAFGTMSAFFVHDLKNAAASLTLMLQNLPVHFDDPAFRQDALRGIGNAVSRIEETIDRLGAFRQTPDFRPVASDLNQLVNDALCRLPDAPGVALVREFHPLPALRADPAQIQSVVTNLVLNARDAARSTAPEGRVVVRTGREGPRIVLSVEDNGCGMSKTFVRDSLFRPFRSTKQKGIGIGLFQVRRTVERHGGSIQVESEPGRGTTFRVSFPLGANG